MQVIIPVLNQHYEKSFLCSRRAKGSIGITSWTVNFQLNGITRWLFEFALLFCAERNYDHCRHINGHFIIITCNIGFNQDTYECYDPRAGLTLISSSISCFASTTLETSVRQFTLGFNFNWNFRMIEFLLREFFMASLTASWLLW